MLRDPALGPKQGTHSLSTVQVTRDSWEAGGKEKIWRVHLISSGVYCKLFMFFFEIKPCEGSKDFKLKNYTKMIAVRIIGW